LKKTYFISDFHLGTPNHAASLVREKRVCAFLDEMKGDMEALYLVGDIFDFWFEYKTVVPKGFVRLLGKLAELRDAGIPIYMFTGNHDLWMKDYFETELSIPVYFEPISRTIGDKLFFIGHGDGLGPGDKGFKRMKKVFQNPLAQWFFRWLHPDIGVGIANFWSRKSRIANGPKDELNYGEDEWLLQYTRRKIKEVPADYFIFGHRHLPMDVQVEGASRYINLGDWINFYTYAVYDGEVCTLKTYTP
jgi:UDP-2,3-diacylglucosamine hydrolase